MAECVSLKVDVNKLNFVQTDGNNNVMKKRQFLRDGLGLSWTGADACWYSCADQRFYLIRSGLYPTFSSQPFLHVLRIQSCSSSSSSKNSKKRLFKEDSVIGNTWRSKERKEETFLQIKITLKCRQFNHKEEKGLFCGMRVSLLKFRMIYMYVWKWYFPRPQSQIKTVVFQIKCESRPKILARPY